MTLKISAKKCLPRCTAFFERISIESLKIRNTNAMHLGKKFLDAIFSAIVYSPFSCSTKEPGSSDILFIFIREARSSGVRASVAILYIRTVFKMQRNIVRLRFFSE